MREFFTALIAELRRELGHCGEDHGTDIGVVYPVEGFADIEIVWWEATGQEYKVVLQFEHTDWVWVESKLSDKPEPLSVRVIEQVQNCIKAAEAVVEEMGRGSTDV